MTNIQRILQMTMLVFIATILVACSSPEKDKETYLKNALDYIGKNEKQAAILELKSAIQVDPKFAEARYQLGLLYLEQNEPKKAFGEITRAADLDPDNLDASLKSAQFYLMARQKDETHKRLDHILQKDPNHQEALTLLANLELIDGQFDAAMSVLDQIGESVETSAQLQNLKGRIYVAQDELTLAEDAFRKAIKLDSANNIAHYFMLLRLYEKNVDQEKAKILLDEMVTKFPDSIQAHKLMAGYHKSVGEKDLIIEELQKVINLAPKEPSHRLQLVTALRDENNYTLAEETLLKAIADLPESEILEANLASLYFDQRKFEESRSLLDELTASGTDVNEVKLLKARFQLKDGAVQEGIALLQKLNKDFPNWPDPYLYLAQAHQSLGETDLAEIAIGNAIQKNKNDFRFHTFLSQLYLTKGSYEDAQKEASIALRLNSKNLKAAIIFGRSFVGTKDFNKAVKLLSALNNQVPNNVEILDGLALALIGSKDIPQAERILLEILKIAPSHNRALPLYLSLKYKDNLQGAIAFIGQQIQENPEDGSLYFINGNLLDKSGQKEAALESYGIAQKINPDTPAPYLAAARLLNSMGQSDKALAKFEEVLAQQPDSLPANMGVAAIYEAKGETQTAMDHYQTILNVKEDFAPAANNLAWLIASEPDGDLGKALQLIMLAKQAYPENANISDTLGWIHYKRKSYALAITQFKQALQVAPDNPTIKYHLALGLAGDEQAEEAKRTLEELLKLEEDFSEKDAAKELLAKLKQ